ncbi:MAG: helix-turn-helix transcriptional regulator [Actinobacteria bacterium]|nr:helix-turn-helix transcriptional regulator [Actinomycetota bacterium]
MPQILTEYDKKVGKKVRDYRITHDISQDKLGKYLKLPKQAISRMENGKRRITSEELAKIALFFDEPIQLFLQDEYKYIYPRETAYGVFPVYMAEFFEDLVKGLEVNIGKDNPTHTNIKKLVNAILEIDKTVTSHQKFKEKRERNNLR